MDVASLVLGIIALIIAFIPVCGSIAFLPAVVGLVLGIIALILKIKANAPKGMSIAGTALNACAIIVIIAWLGVAAIGAASTVDEIDKAVDELEDYQQQLEQLEQELNQ